MTTFMKKHSILLVGIVIYLLAFVCSNIYNPWLEYSFAEQLDYFLHPQEYGFSAADHDKKLMGLWMDSQDSGSVLGIYAPNFLSENQLVHKVPLHMFYFAMEDLAVALHNGAFFSLVIFTFAYLLEKYLVTPIAVKSGVTNKTEKWVIGYLYSSFLIYLLSCLAGAIELTTTSFFEFGWAPDLSGAPVALKIIGVIGMIFLLLAMIFYLALPALANGLFYFLVYSLGIRAGAGLIDLIDLHVLQTNFIENQILYDILGTILAILILVPLNFLMEFIQSKMQFLVSFPYLLTGKGIRKLVRKFHNPTPDPDSDHDPDPDPEADSDAPNPPDENG